MLREMSEYTENASREAHELAKSRRFGDSAMRAQQAIDWLRSRGHYLESDALRHEYQQQVLYFTCWKQEVGAIGRKGMDSLPSPSAYVN